MKMFSIITVCFNNLEGLKRTQQSIVSQTCDDYEWIVVDGNSTDGTAEYLMGIKQKHCIWVSEPDKGIYDAMNKGIERVSGVYMIFMNSGDEFASSDILLNVTNQIEALHHPDFIYGDSLELHSSGATLYKKAHSHKRIWYGMFTHHQAMLYKRSAVNQVRYRLNYKIAADYGFTCEVLPECLQKVHVPFAICLFEGGGLTANTISHWRGIKEQWSVGKVILRNSFFRRVYTALLHLGKHVFIRAMPRLHRAIRYGDSNGR